MFLLMAYHGLCCYSTVALKEDSLRMQIMLGSLQLLHSGPRARGEGEEERFSCTKLACVRQREAGSKPGGNKTELGGRMREGEMGKKENVG